MSRVRRKLQSSASFASFCSSLLFLIFCLLVFPASAATDDLTSLLQKGLFEEEANRNLSAAITNYESLAKQFEQNRQIAATAVFRLGECYRKLGQTNEAAVQYQRILRDFSDQPTLITLSRPNLAGMGKANVSTNATSDKTGDASTADEANALAAKLNSLKKFEDDPEKYARAVCLLFPEKPLNAMVENLLQLRELGEKLKKDPNTKIPDFAQEAFLATADTYGRRLEGIVTPERITVQVQKQLQFLTQRANSIVSNQKLRLEVLQSVAKASGENGEAELAVVEDPEQKEIRRIQAMIQNSPDLINSTAPDLDTPLMIATRLGQLRVLNFLLDHGADVNLKRGGRTALHDAVRTGNKAVVELLLNLGADVDATDSDGRTALHRCVEMGFRSVAEVLLAHHADINARANRGVTPLIEAVQDEQFDMVEPLLAAKADPNISTVDGITPLSLAAQLKNPEVVRQLLNAGAKPDAGDLNLPLFWAIKYADTNLAEMLLRAGADPNKPARIDYRITTGPRDSVRTNLPLEFALWSFPPDKTEIVKLLLRFKANPKANDSAGLPLIFYGIYDSENLRALLNAGADPNVVLTNPNWLSDTGGETPLMVAAKRSLRRYVDNLGRNMTGYEHGDPVKAKLLIDRGAKVNVSRPSDGMTPLHLAAQSGSPEMVELLLTNKAEVNVRNKNGQTPLDLAKNPPSPIPPRPVGTQERQAFEQIITLLRQHGALDNLPDFSVIRLTRQGLDKPIPVFEQNTNGWNQFTLMETLLRFYQKKWGTGGHPLAQAVPDFLSFPDLTRVIIHRPSDAADGKEQTIQINLLNSTNGFDCEKNVPLKFGDVVEIPIREYRLREPILGLTGTQANQMYECIKRGVTVNVRDQVKTLSGLGSQSFLSEIIQRSEVQSLLLSSSDLSRVKVIRQHGSGERKQEWTIDCAPDKGHATYTRPPPPPVAVPGGDRAPSFPGAGDSETDLWLRDGDVIEIPEK